MADASGGIVRAVARRRVTLGFVAAAVMLAVARPNTNGTSVATWDPNAAATTRRCGVSDGM